MEGLQERLGQEKKMRFAPDSRIMTIRQVQHLELHSSEVFIPTLGAKRNSISVCSFSTLSTLVCVSFILLRLAELAKLL